MNRFPKKHCFLIGSRHGKKKIFEPAQQNIHIGSRRIGSHRFTSRRFTLVHVVGSHYITPWNKNKAEKINDLNWFIVEKNYELVQKSFCCLIGSQHDRKKFIWTGFLPWCDMKWTDMRRRELMWTDAMRTHVNIFLFRINYFSVILWTNQAKIFFVELVQIIYFLVWCEMMWIDLTSTDLNIFEPVQISYFLSSILLINEAKKKRFWTVQNFFFLPWTGPYHLFFSAMVWYDVNRCETTGTIVNQREVNWCEYFFEPVQIIFFCHGVNRRRIVYWCEPMWTDGNRYEQIWTDVNRWEPTYSKPIWIDGNRWEPKWADENRCYTMRTDVNRCEPMWTDENRYEPMWTDGNRYEPTWTDGNRCEQTRKLIET